jgi:protoheme IX farnesyltransferase
VPDVRPSPVPDSSATRDFAIVARLAGWTAALMYVLIVVGSIVRTTDSGLSCPDWPLCHGQLIPPMQFNIFMEWIHRLIALVVGLGLVSTALWVMAHRATRARLGGLAALAIMLYLTQALLGALTVWKLLDPNIVSGHLAVGLLLFSTLLTLALSARHEAAPPATPVARPAGLLPWFAIAVPAVWLQAVLGGMVSTNHASLICHDWPTCNGEWFPPMIGLVAIQMSHRFAAYALIVLIGLLAWRASRSATPSPVDWVAACSISCCSRRSSASPTSIWASRCGSRRSSRQRGAAAGARDPRHVPPRGAARGARVTVAPGVPVTPRGGFAAWLELTKPRIVLLVLFTGVPALLLAAQGWPAPMLFWGTVAGITLSAASAASFNHYFDRDIDALMVRTRTRPLPSGALPPSAAVVLGFVLAALATIVLVATSNVLAAIIALVSIAYYALFYTVWLKRRTPLNIVIGGGAGASAPLIAWAAVTGRVELPAILLASIIFLWTPPHFWALSLYRRDDYARANIPMLPVTDGRRRRGGRSCSTRSCSSAARSWSHHSPGSASRISCPPRCSVPDSSWARCGCTARRACRTRRACSVSRSCTCSCCSS